MRVLHLIDQPGPAGETLAVRLSLDASNAGPADKRHAWLLLGGEPMYDAAKSAGLDLSCTRFMPMPDGLRRVVPGALRRLKTLLEQADQVMCWTQGAAAIASRIGCPHAVPRFGQATLCAFAKQVIDQAVSNLSPLTEKTGEGGGSQSLANRCCTRAALRDRWGVTEDTIVVALLADRPSEVDAREALLAALFTHETLAAAKAAHGDMRLLCHPLTHRRVDANVLSEMLGQPQLVLQDAGVLCPWQTLPGCDFALAPDPQQAGLSILWANALSVPTITPPEPRLPMLDELGQITIAASGAAKHLAHGLTAWSFSKQPAPTAIGS